MRKLGKKAASRHRRARPGSCRDRLPVLQNILVTLVQNRLRGPRQKRAIRAIRRRGIHDAATLCSVGTIRVYFCLLRAVVGVRRGFTHSAG